MGEDDTGPVGEPVAASVGQHAGRPMRTAAWLAAALLCFPAALGAFWLARDSGAARPLCGDRPGRYYPACQLPAPFGSGAPPTTTGFQP